jgi:hypothetical protein
LLLTSGWTQLFCGLAIAASALAMRSAARSLGVHPACLIWFPLTPYLKLHIIWQGVLTVLLRRGIDWRGTFYPLDELQRNMVPVAPWRKFRTQQDKVHAAN